ncbi:serine/threonine/tyrosine-interacting-like protein 1 [Asterias rubens]|uniref:serine/threonine/tyrosine-interacting-like protein 1 n=1 Tax=Asterias rubens TaxID=7604 RepID=UPI001454F65F|nr:serine/threonine/tyrosine-interacting-like protein 1 [Asterias rubens]XP_033627927.1 serine/threonine/tyrosine-interacting-like protein 1 [Asterias rubens]
MAARIVMCEPTELYNILQQATSYPCLSDPNYLLLLDARQTNEYNESHIITAKKAPRSPSGEFLVPYDGELECKMHVVVLDSKAHSLKDQGSAVACALVMSEMGSRNPVKILRGGYEEFSALYPFLRTQKIIYMPRELDELVPYPVEVLPGRLYLGDCRQACRTSVRKELKIKAVVCLTTEANELASDLNSDQLLQIQVSDDEEGDLDPHLNPACQFLGKVIGADQAALVCSDHGLSRSVSVVLAYLMVFYKWSLKEAHKHLLDCKSNIRPHRSFVHQLSKWEKTVFGETLTDVSDPNF